VKTQRVGWFGCACCPPNLARLFASLSRYSFSVLADGLAIHLYADSEIRVNFRGAATQLAVQTDYPWSGEIKISVTPAEPVRFALLLRLPGWCRSPQLSLNGESVELSAFTRSGYASLDREWKAGDEVTLSLPMPVERIRAHPRVTQDAGCVAIQRGPLVYCLEEADNGAHLGAVRLPKDSALRSMFDSRLLGGVVAIEGEGERVRAANDDLYSTAEPTVEPFRIRAIPYAFWANRGEGEMRVWIRES
jgi:DUF1680 family protein